MNKKDLKFYIKTYFKKYNFYNKKEEDKLFNKLKDDNELLSNKNELLKIIDEEVKNLKNINQKDEVLSLNLNFSLSISLILSLITIFYFLSFYFYRFSSRGLQYESVHNIENFYYIFNLIVVVYYLITIHKRNWFDLFLIILMSIVSLISFILYFNANQYQSIIDCKPYLFFKCSIYKDIDITPEPTIYYFPYLIGMIGPFLLILNFIFRIYLFKKVNKD